MGGCQKYCLFREPCIILLVARRPIRFLGDPTRGRRDVDRRPSGATQGPPGQKPGGKFAKALKLGQGLSLPSSSAQLKANPKPIRTSLTPAAQSIHLSIYLSICLSVCLPMYHVSHLSFDLAIYVCICMHTHTKLGYSGTSGSFTRPAAGASALSP